MAAEPELVIKFKGDTKDLESNIEKLKSSLGSLTPATNNAAKGNKKLEDSNNSLGNSFGSLLKGYLSYQAAMAAGKFILDATLEVSKFETQLNTASGSQEKFGQNMAFLEDLANTYKKNVVDLGASFSQLTIATKGTNLEGAETEKLFKAVTVASSALKMSTDDTTGTFRAFIQMVSKGNVQAEELRGQLGERLYGAFNLAAKAMGVTTSELNKMLVDGRVLASDLLPKLSTLMLETFSKDAAEGAKTLGSNIDYSTGQLTLFVAELAKSTGLESGVNSLVSSFGDMLSTLRQLNKESSISKGFFDRMFTLPGDKLRGSNVNKGQETKEQRFARLNAILNKSGNTSGKTFSGDKSSTSTNDYSKQFDIREIDPSAEAKIISQREAAARKRASGQKRLDAQELSDAREALDAKLTQSAYDIEAAYRKYNGIVQDVIGEEGKTGLSIILDKNSFDNIGQEFTNAVTGDGSTVERWNQLADATKNGMAKFVSEVKSGGKSYKETIDELIKEDNIGQLNQNITNALRDTAANTAVAFGEMIGSALAGGDGFENAAIKFGLLIAGLISDIGKALITFAVLVIAAENTISNPFVALAAGIAAVAAGAFLKSKLSEGQEQGFYTGGIVRGKSGLDAIPARLTAGEMVLNDRQQANMFKMINGDNSPRNIGGNFATSGRNNQFVGQLTATIKAGDLAVAVKYGEKKNNKFS